MGRSLVGGVLHKGHRLQANQGGLKPWLASARLGAPGPIGDLACSDWPSIRALIRCSGETLCSRATSAAPAYSRQGLRRRHGQGLRRRRGRGRTWVWGPWQTRLPLRRAPWWRSSAWRTLRGCARHWVGRRSEMRRTRLHPHLSPCAPMSQLISVCMHMDMHKHMHVHMHMHMHMHKQM